ncbi:transcription factor bHLH18-like [Bidens hawaiensis]|uniref:transcription factor bHLH18-like n=1 Tax=Bidens hawaiensis TaxID=980011 RepID=UPI004049A3AA
MDNPFMAWLPELEMEESRQILKHQQAHPRYNNSVDSFSSESFKGYPNLVTGHQSIHLTTNNGDADKQQDHKANKICHGSPSSTFTISFGNPTPQENIDQFQLYGRSNLKHQDGLTPKEETIESLNELLGSFSSTKFRSTRRNYRQAQEHVLAERKRREKLAERFVSLSALLPGLKKMDKATVLEDTCNYIIQLQTRVKELEDKCVKGKDIIQESAVILAGKNKFCGHHEDVASSSDDANDLPSSSCSPEIKARISGSKILVRIYSMKSSSLVLKTLTEMEKLHITITCFSVVPFNTAHLVAITAQVSDKMVITAKYLVKCLQSALRDSD